LGILLQTTGAHDDASQSFSQALLIYEQQLGSDHESTTDVRRALAACNPANANANQLSQQFDAAQ
jgi:hypothetical protein